MKVLASGSSTGVVQSEWNCSILLGSWVVNLPSIAKTQTELPVISAWWSLSCLGKDGPRYPIRFGYILTTPFKTGLKSGFDMFQQHFWLEIDQKVQRKHGTVSKWPETEGQMGHGRVPQLPIAMNPYESLPLPCVTSAWNVYSVASLLINAVLFSRAAPVLCCIITFRSYWFQMKYHAYVSYMYWMPRRRSSFYTTQKSRVWFRSFLVTF